jgi:uncharacterized protein YaiI (UPF0178 family)
MTILYLDADACPVKGEAYQVAGRYKVPVKVVANAIMRVPTDPLIELVVREGFGVVDDWIAEQVTPADVVVTSDIPLAGRALAKGARVLGPKGWPFTDEMIGEALATRELLDTLRQGGAVTGGPGPMSDRDRSRFRAKLDEMINAAIRGK